MERKSKIRNWVGKDVNTLQMGRRGCVFVYRFILETMQNKDRFNLINNSMEFSSFVTNIKFSSNKLFYGLILSLFIFAYLLEMA